MKKLCLLLSLVFLVFLLLSCDKDKDRPRILTVTSERYYTVDGESGFRILVYLVKFDKSDDWKSVFSIKGFDYEAGYEYKLKVREKHISDPPAGGSSIEYSLKELLSKTAKDSEGLPENSVKE